MKCFKQGALGLAALMIAVQPCAAADLAPQEGTRHSGVFAGATLRVPLGQGRAPREEARAGLSFGATHVYRGTSATSGERRVQADMVELGIRRSGTASFAIGGRQLLDDKGRLRVQGDDDEDDGGISPWLIGAGVVVAALGIGYLVLLDELDCTDEDECN